MTRFVTRRTIVPFTSSGRRDRRENGSDVSAASRDLAALKNGSRKLPGECNEFRLARGSRFFEDAQQVRPDRADGNIKLGRGFLNRLAIGDFLEDAPFRLCQAEQRCYRFPCTFRRYGERRKEEGEAFTPIRPKLLPL